MEKQHEINSIGVVYFVLLLANIMIFTGFLVLIGLGVAVPDTLASFLPLPIMQVVVHGLQL